MHKTKKETNILLKCVMVLVLSVSMLQLMGCSDKKSVQEYIDSAKKYHDLKEYKSAIIELKNAIKLDGKSAEVRYLLGQVYLDAANGHSAQKEISRAKDYGMPYARLASAYGQAYWAIADDKGLLESIVVEEEAMDDALKADLYALRARAYFKQGKDKEANAALNKAEKLGSAQALVSLTLAMRDSEMGAYDNAQAWLQPLLTKSDRFAADAWSLMGEIAQKQAQFDEAISGYSNAISIRKAVSPDYLKRAMLYISKKQYDLATSDLQTFQGNREEMPIVVFAQGLIAYSQDDLEEALARFEKVVSSKANYKPALLYLGLTHYRLNDFQKAINHLQRYLLAYPGAYEATLIVSAALIQEKDFDEAITLLSGLSPDYPNDDRVNSLLGNALILSGNLEGGIDHLKRALVNNPDDAKTHLKLGQAILKKGEVSAGRRELKKAIELDSQLLEADLSLYLSYMQRNEYEKALEVARQLSLKKTDNSMAVNLLALAYFDNNQEAVAIKKLEETLEAMPGDMLTLNNLAQIYLRKGETGPAEQYYHIILKNNPDHLMTLTQLAIIAARNEDVAGVEKWLKKSVSGNPSELMPKVLLANHYLQQAKPLLANQVLQDVGQEDRLQLSYLLLKAKVKLATDAPDHAIRVLKQLLAAEPNMVTGYFLLAQAYAANKQVEHIESTLKKGLAIDPKHLPSNIVLARILLRKKDLGAAEAHIQQFASLYPKHASIKWLKARLASREGKFDSAMEYFQDLMEEMPQSGVVMDLARSQWLSGDKAGAIVTLELWASEHPDDVRTQLMLAQYYLVENRFSDAKKIYAQLEVDQADNVELLNNMAWMYKDDAIDKALEYAKKSYRLEPENPYVMDTYGVLLGRVGDNDRALELLLKAKSKLDKQWDIRIHVIELSIKMGRFEAAQKEINELEGQADTREKQDQLSVLIKRVKS